MAQQLATSIENNFTKGLITESTGLNFPENAATSADNCEFTLIGDVTRRFGIDYETNYTTLNSPKTNNAISTYKWNNVGGDGSTQIVVEQIGSTLYFYKSSSATVASPLSTQLLASSVNMAPFVATGGVFDATVECQYTDGNGYLFVYHPTLTPFYCSYNGVTNLITANPISISIRDFEGLPDTNGVTTRPPVLSSEHQYNLQNQGWTSGTPWSALSLTPLNPAAIGIGNNQTISVFNNSSLVTLPITLGDTIQIYYSAGTAVIQIFGTVTAYTGATLNFTLLSYFDSSYTHTMPSGSVITPVSVGYINTWLAGVGNYPSNADVWWYFKNSAGAYSPSTTVAQVSLGSGPAPKGHYIIGAFDQQLSTISGIAGLSSVTTTVRPRTGTWFQGRVWYAGVDASQQATGDQDYFTWTENIYFSQIVKTPEDFGHCYQTNDPTSQTLFDLLPTDGGVITIQGCGSIYKLFALQNALLVFAANGVWYITGSQGIGFTANDYTIVKLSAIQSISSTSVVDVSGLPYFWNEEGIYKVAPAKQGTGLLSNPLHVNPLELIPITLGTILTLYNTIPLSSKKYARGVYNPIDYTIQWIYRDLEANTVTDRYKFNKILNFNTSNNAFFPYTVDNSAASINSIVYVVGPGGSTSPGPTIKYVASVGDLITFAEEQDASYRDWASTVPVNYESFFVTGFKLKGQAIKQFQPQYIQMYSRTDGIACGYKIQGIWNYAINPHSNKYSNIQQVNIAGSPYYSTTFKRHRIRGSGYALQFKIISNDGIPFDIQGWAVVDTVNAGT